jgi:hypothetical protein
VVLARFLDPVGDPELLGRVLFDPDDVDSNGLTPRAIPTQDLKNPCRGWSVQRIACAPHVLYQIASERTNRRKDLTVAGVAIVSAQKIRRIECEGQPDVAIVDPAPTPFNEGHSIILGTAGRNDSFYKAIKKAIMAHLEVLSGVAEAVDLAMTPSTPD